MAKWLFVGFLFVQDLQVLKRIQERRIFKKFLLVLSLFLLIAPEVAAEKKEKGEAGTKIQAAIRGYIPVQLLSLSIPTKGRGGRVGRGPMTIFVVVRGQKNVESFCNLLPRVREAITITVDQSPVPIIGDKYVFQEIGTKLQRAINKVLPKPLIISLHIFPISRHMGQGAKVLELPGTSGECMALKEMPQDLEDMLRGKDTEAKSFSVGEAKTPPSPKKIKPRSQTEVARGPLSQPAIIVSKGKSAPLEGNLLATKDCRPLKMVWSKGYHKTSGALFWLNKAFSLDEDNDGAVDNVGFILKSEDRPNLFIYYFPGPGRQSVISVPTLKLKDDRNVLKTCFGKVSYEKPKVVTIKPPPGFKPPDLAGELAAKSKEKEGAVPVAVSNGKPDLTNGMGLVFIVAISAGFLLIMGGVLGYVLARRKVERRRKERRQAKERRRGERREKDVPAEGEDRRKGKDRRDAERRGDDERRDDEDRRE